MDEDIVPENGGLVKIMAEYMWMEDLNNLFGSYFAPIAFLFYAGSLVMLFYAIFRKNRIGVLCLLTGYVLIGIHIRLNGYQPFNLLGMLVGWMLLGKCIHHVKHWLGRAAGALFIVAAGVSMFAVGYVGQSDGHRPLSPAGAVLDDAELRKELALFPSEYARTRNVRIEPVETQRFYQYNYPHYRGRFAFLNLKARNEDSGDGIKQAVVHAIKVYQYVNERHLPYDIDIIEVEWTPSGLISPSSKVTQVFVTQEEYRELAVRTGNPEEMADLWLNSFKERHEQEARSWLEQNKGN